VRLGAAAGKHDATYVAGALGARSDVRRAPLRWSHVYSVSSASSLLRARRALGRGRSGPRVSRTVVLLGLTSLFTDIAAEMVVTVLPLYLVYVGQFSPVAFGFVDGIQRGAAALVGLASGFAGDRFRRHKEVAAAGYGLSAVVKLGLATAGTALSAISALVLLDRIGKGIRTAPRDAMISMSTPQEDLGAAFGVHRALDTIGAMLGPLLAFAILAIAANAFTSVFVVAFCIALIGVGILVLLVPQPRPRGEDDAAATAEVAEAQGQRVSLREALVVLGTPRFRALLIAAGALALATASDAFIFLVLQDKLDLSLGLFPLLFVGMTGVYMVLAVPVGRIADRIGRGRVLLGGYALLLGVYGALLAPLDGPLLVALALALMGTFYAATDGVLAAFGSAIVPEAVRGSGLALLNTTSGVAKLLSSIAFGALWTLTSTEAAIAVFGAALVVAMGLAALVFVRTRQDVGDVA
jgi:MFS family permease